MHSDFGEFSLTYRAILNSVSAVLSLRSLTETDQLGPVHYSD